MSATHEHVPTASTFARVGALVYALLIIYASLFPFSGWRDNGIAPHAFLLAPLPHYWTFFDALTNIIGYVPFGLLIAFTGYPYIRGLGAVALALVAGALLSGAMEAIQTYLPSRVPSNLDFLTNVSGTLVGGLAGMLLTRTFLEQSRFLSLRRHWFWHDAGRGLIVVGLWPLAQIYPQEYLFGNGQLTLILSNWLSNWFAFPIDLAAFLRYGVELSLEQYWLAETVITTCGMTSAILLLLTTVKQAAPRALLALTLLTLALAVKAMASALLFTPAHAFSWFTPGAQGGILFSGAILFGLAYAPQAVQRHIALLIMAIGLFIVNAMPANPYFLATLQTWTQGKFLNFNGAAQFLSLLWPFFALWFLVHPTHRLKAA